MGALHAGHISLITISKQAGQTTVASIFVNPTQFNDPKDFQKYPITIEKDIELLEKAGCDALYLPDSAEVYPGGTAHLEHYPLGYLETILEGEYRPGHFQGVCQVMSRLLKLVGPDHLFMGQKDYQQCMVIEKLIQLLNMPTRLHRCPIVRESDGLAMSSRNMRLTPEQREKATTIYQALQAIQAGRAAGAPEAGYLAQARQLLEKAGFRIDYVALADPDTLDPRTGPAAVFPAPVVALIAAFLGEIRLIDNLVL